MDGKVYVGITHTTMEERWRNHVRKAKNLSKNGNANYFQRAIVKYGKDAWDHDLLEVIEGTIQDAEEAERKWIAYYESNNKQLGYNLTPGGNISQSKMSDEVRQKISKKIKIIMSDTDWKERQSKIMKEWAATHENPFKGKKHSEESLQKMSEAIKKWHETNENPWKGKTHDEETRAKMSEVAQKRCKDPNWVSPLSKLTKEERAKNNQYKKGTHPGKHSKETIYNLCVELKSIDKVAEKLGCTKANICYLMKSYGIRDELNKILYANNLSLKSKDEFIEIAMNSVSQQDMANKLGCTKQALYYNFDRLNIREDIKRILKQNKVKQ